MSSPFYEISKQVSDEFLQSIAFIDDEASYSESKDAHRLNAQQVTQMFAASNKICSIYKVTAPEDIENTVTLSKKCDVTVLDWRINVKGDLDDDSQDEEADDDDDIRGKFASDLIKRLFQERTEKLKLILVYTAENDFDRIIDQIKEALSEIEITPTENGFSLSHGNYRIAVYGKATLKGRRLKKEVEERLLEYSELPGKVVAEFTNISHGLLKNLALKAMSVIRENTYSIVETFSDDLDPSFLAHKALLPAPNDASDQILEIMGSEIKSLLLTNNIADSISNETIKHYIESTLPDQEFDFDVPSKEKFETVEIPETVTREDLVTFTKRGIEQVLVPKDAPGSESQLFSEVVGKTLTKLYLHGEIVEIDSNRKLAMLTSVKSNYNDAYLPILTLGTVVYYSKEYWVCITPKCDCTRIKKNRDLLFAPLKAVTPEDSFDFILKSGESYQYFKVNYSIHQTRFFKLKGNADGAVQGVRDKEKILLKGESQLEWLGELKSDFAQSIANNFSAQLARVGMDHSEWLRRS